MLNASKQKSKLYCFTPEVMLATFVIEFTLALIVFVKYKLSPKIRICAFTLICLGAFQLAEYQICRGSHGMLWAHIGFAAITLLPAMGLDLVTVADKDRKVWVPFGYFVSLAMIATIFYSSAIQSAICGGNYVIFNMSSVVTATFMIYYMGLLFLGVGLDIRDYLRAKKARSVKKVRYFFWVVAGYISFLFPTGVVYLLSSQARLGTTSIMCGFALIMAFILFFKTIPTLLFLKIGRRA